MRFMTIKTVILELCKVCGRAKALWARFASRDDSCDAFTAYCLLSSTN